MGLKGPSVKEQDKVIIEKYAIKYLTNKYGDNDYKITNIEYEFDMDYVFDYSTPIGYNVEFKSDKVSKCWLLIKGLKQEDFIVDKDYYIEEYYFSDREWFDIYEIMNNMKPKEELEKVLLNELQQEFSKDIYEVNCKTILLEIPEDFGRIPTLDELKTNINLYKVTYFDYKESNALTNTEEYKRKLKSYFMEKYNYNKVDIFIIDNEENKVSVYLG